MSDNMIANTEDTKWFSMDPRGHGGAPSLLECLSNYERTANIVWPYDYEVCVHQWGRANPGCRWTYKGVRSIRMLEPNLETTAGWAWERR